MGKILQFSKKQDAEEGGAIIEVSDDFGLISERVWGAHITRHDGAELEYADIHIDPEGKFAYMVAFYLLPVAGRHVRVQDTVTHHIEEYEDRLDVLRKLLARLNC